MNTHNITNHQNDYSINFTFYDIEYKSSIDIIIIDNKSSNICTHYIKHEDKLKYIELILHCINSDQYYNIIKNNDVYVIKFEYKIVFFEHQTTIILDTSTPFIKTLQIKLLSDRSVNYHCKNILKKALEVIHYQKDIKNYWDLYCSDNKLLDKYYAFIMGKIIFKNNKCKILCRQLYDWNCDNLTIITFDEPIELHNIVIDIIQNLIQKNYIESFLNNLPIFNQLYEIDVEKNDFINKIKKSQIISIDLKSSLELNLCDAYSSHIANVISKFDSDGLNHYNMFNNFIINKSQQNNNIFMNKILLYNFTNKYHMKNFIENEYIHEIVSDDLNSFDIFYSAPLNYAKIYVKLPNLLNINEIIFNGFPNLNLDCSNLEQTKIKYIYFKNTNLINKVICIKLCKKFNVEIFL